MDEIEKKLKTCFWSWRRGIVVIASANRTEDPGFESRQGVMFLGLYAYIAVLLSKLKMQCHCVYLRKKTNAQKECVIRKVTKIAM
jgi:hypothetical protein